MCVGVQVAPPVSSPGVGGSDGSDDSDFSDDDDEEGEAPEHSESEGDSGSRTHSGVLLLSVEEGRGHGSGEEEKGYGSDCVPFSPLTGAGDPFRAPRLLTPVRHATTSSGTVSAPLPAHRPPSGQYNS